MTTKPRRWFALALASLGTAWCVGVGLWIWFTPLRYSVVTGGTGRADRHAVVEHSFSEVSGLGPLPLLIPLALAVAATWSAWNDRRVKLVVFTLLFVAFTFVAGFSIGGAYIPAAAILLLATTCHLLVAWPRQRT